jgi:hypothetical protein
MSPACAGDHAKSKWGYLTEDVGRINRMKQVITLIVMSIVMSASVMAEPLTKLDPKTKTYFVGTNVVIRIGFLAEEVSQHPIVVAPSIDGTEQEAQFYFDVGEKPGTMNQIIVVYPVKMKIPTERGRKIELKGTADRISLTGGKVGTSRYENEVFHLQSWQYLDEKSPPIQESIQEITRRLSPGGITKDEAIQIANAAYRVLWGEPPGELKVTQCELNKDKTWVVEVWWDLGLPNGGARFWIRQTGSFERAEYIPGE